MSTEKILAICQFGGDFIANSDGSMIYIGGEAHVIDIDQSTHFHELVAEISDMFNCNLDIYSIKYFLRNNKRTLITVSNDKDLRRMIDYNVDSTIDLYLVKKVENRIIRSVVADSGTSTDVITAADGEGSPDTKRLRVTNGWDNLITGVGQAFDTSKEFREALHKYAIAKGFVYKFIKSEGPRVTVVCSAKDCPWRIHASKSSANQDFTIKKMNDTHTCERENSKQSHRLATQSWVASVIKEKLRETPDYKPRDIANDLQREYGLRLSYHRAWRGKAIAEKELHGSQEQAGNQLPWLCEKIMETNPGSIAVLQADDLKFIRLFLSFNASLNGFEHGCRPLLFLDAVTLKAVKRWKLLTATAVDGENDMFPVAMAVVNTETIENWHWFLLELKSAIGLSRTLTFVSNRQNGLVEAVSEVFEEGFHGYCTKHLIQEFKAELGDSWSQEMKDTMVDNLLQAVYACKADEFNSCVENIKAKSPDLAEWVLSAKPELWSDAFFKGLRFGQFSSAAVQMFNEWISTRQEPSVLQMIDTIRCRVMELIYKRHESSNTWTETLLTPSMARKVELELSKSRHFSVVCSTTGVVFEVKDGVTNNIINMETWECTCRRWQLRGLPCAHALAVIERSGWCIYDFCSKYFTTAFYRQAYLLSINPIADPAHSSSLVPFRAKRLPGRPKKKPVEPRITSKRAVRCSKCRGYGHYKQTCTTSAL
ncbi:ubiquitin-conjugating enzyme E2 S [Apostasia shenzhenica]|uniref:Ubiquitin-conjugating enzyme E2 S n=1 Tax=Apostasia shenzhenica TaxID=1088818 RepID=A0A2I0ANR6_9ASPA|nr:ubiquitin-conjugating enzyme E2 S [Apostasia shenzhenica]